MEFIVIIVLVIFSIILHEVAHGVAAYAMGDPTAKYAGRLTLNPLPHIDPIGSVLVPGLLAMSGTGLMVGWAKPVPFNEHNLRAPFGLPRKYAEALVAAAGPATNIALAILGAVLLRTFILDLAPGLAPIAIAFIVSNLGLAILNMLPIPPLDGSKVVASILPPHLERQYRQLEQYAYMLGPIGLILVLYIVVTFLSPVLSQAVQFLFDILMGR